MITYLRELHAEQTSPLELVAFLTVAITACMAGAFLAYVALGRLFWSFGLRGRIPFARVLFPTRGQFGESAVDAGLALFTSGVLLLTLHVKHEVVRGVEAFDLERVGAEEIAEVLPLRSLHGVEDTAALTAGLAGAALIEPLVAAGSASEARRFVARSVLPRLERPGTFAWATTTNLLVVAVALVAAVLLWMLVRRTRALRKDATAEVQLARPTRSILILSFCVAVLLASPSLLADEDLARGSVALAEYRVAADEPEAGPLADALERQRSALSKLAASAETGGETNRALVERLDRLEERVRALADGDPLDGLRREVDALREELAAGTTPEDDCCDRVDRILGTGFLVVSVPEDTRYELVLQEPPDPRLASPTNPRGTPLEASSPTRTGANGNAGASQRGEGPGAFPVRPGAYTFVAGRQRQLVTVPPGGVGFVRVDR